MGVVLRAARHRPGPRPGRQGVAGIVPRRARDGATVRRGGADRRSAPASGDRPGLRARLPGRPPAVHCDAAGPGADVGRAAGRARRPGRRPAADGGDLRVGLPDDGLCAREGRDPPRPEAVERHGGELRRGPGDGLGAGQGAGRRTRRRRRSRRPARSRGPARGWPPGAAAWRARGMRRGRGACWGPRPTWRPSRPGARSRPWTSGPTSSRWARSCARC